MVVFVPSCALLPENTPVIVPDAWRFDVPRQDLYTHSLEYLGRRIMFGLYDGGQYSYQRHAVQDLDKLPTRILFVDVY